jgi:hypothetical protein
VVQDIMPADELLDYAYRGARALVLLHEQTMREFLRVWRRARLADVRLPATDDPDYVSLEALLHHGLRAARGYMTWLCEKLDLPDPGIEPAPGVDTVEKDAERFLEHLLARWRLPLTRVEEKRFGETYKTRWNQDMTCESMLEHAVVHPMRHSFQLEQIMESQAAGKGHGRG